VQHVRGDALTYIRNLGNASKYREDIKNLFKDLKLRFSPPTSVSTYVNISQDEDQSILDYANSFEKNYKKYFGFTISDGVSTVVDLDADRVMIFNFCSGLLSPFKSITHILSDKVTSSFRSLVEELVKREQALLMEKSNDLKVVDLFNLNRDKPVSRNNFKPQRNSRSSPQRRRHCDVCNSNKHDRSFCRKKCVVCLKPGHSAQICCWIFSNRQSLNLISDTNYFNQSLFKDV